MTARGKLFIGPEIRFGAVTRKRVTGYGVSCSDHGAMPVLAKDRTAAVTAAGLHLQHEHHGVGKIREIGNFRNRSKGRRWAA